MSNPKVNPNHFMHPHVKDGKVISVDIECYSCKILFNVKVGETINARRKYGNNFYYCSKACASGN